MKMPIKGWETVMEILDTSLVEDLDLTRDEHWVSVFSPYHGEMVPSWMITQAARYRMQDNG